MDSINSAFIKTLLDVKTISNNGILTDDLPYNTLFYPKGKKLFIIDTDDYSFSDMDSSSLYASNNAQVGNSLKMFLVAEYFDGVVRSNKYLFDLYKNGDFLIFLREYRKVLSEMSSKKVVMLGDESDYIDKENRGSYVRLLSK